MSVNSSSDFSFHLWPNFPACLTLFTVSFVGCILLLPLYIFVLYLGYQRWRKQRTGATSETTSHSDIITYHMATIEIISILGSCFYCHSMFTGYTLLLAVGLNLRSVIAPAQVLFHVLTCVERYLAVVHPVTYRRLKVSGGVRIRNTAIGCVWLISFATTSIEGALHLSILLKLVFLLVSLIVICSCSISVLCTLLHTTPGETGSNRGRVDQSKRRVVHTVMAITGALLLRCLSSLVTNLLNISFKTNPVSLCLIACCAFWFIAPSSLVLPLLFLQRAGKLPCARYSNVST